MLEAGNDATWMTDGDLADDVLDSFAFTSTHSQMVAVVAVPQTGPLGTDDGCSSVFVSVEYFTQR